MIKFVKKKYLFIDLIILVLFLLPSSIPTNARSEEIKNPGKVFIESFSTFDINFDPATSYDTLSLRFSQNTYETLVVNDWNQPGSFLGVLADNWTISSDGKVYTFYLKSGIKFQDGSTFNAYTMKFSLDRMLIINENQGPAFLLQEHIVGGDNLLSVKDANITDAKKYLLAGGISVVDNYTLKIIINNPYTPFLAILANYGHAISPLAVVTHRPDNYSTDQTDDMYGMISLSDMFPNLHDWTKLGLEGNHNPAVSGIVPQSDVTKPSLYTWTRGHMVGTGPYILETYTKKTVKLIKNNNWHGLFAPNAVDEINWSVEPDNEKRDLHFILGETDYHFNAHNLFDFINNKGKSLIDGTIEYNKPVLGNYIAYFDLNDNASKFIKPAIDIGKTWNQTHINNSKLIRFFYNNSFFASLNNPFTCLKFREAFSFAFNYDSFILEAFNAVLAKRSQGTIPYGMDGYLDYLIAKEIIPSFNIEKAKELFQEVAWRGNITLMNTGIAKGSLTTLHYLLKSSIESMNIGISINIDKVNETVFDKNYYNIPIRITGWRADYNDAYNMVFGQLHSKGYISQFVTKYSNPVVDKLIDQSEFESNHTKRLQLFREIETKTTNDYPFIYLWNEVNGYLVRTWLSGIKESGSLDANALDLKWQFISKGTPSTTIPTSTSTSTETTALGFESIMAIGLMMFAFKRKSHF